eukprot:TRINITY_DN9940_c0_g1_i1.p1 TRINITY_DN9940_c0_g1~~TRINITY_DN9940_c0_g1_i1.p1  ORF type:complete len:244 (+),score=28.04 TRINITY_DN9940_c0_g1_i1:673-1404(+)
MGFNFGSCAFFDNLNHQDFVFSIRTTQNRTERKLGMEPKTTEPGFQLHCPVFVPFSSPSHSRSLIGTAIPEGEGAGLSEDDIQLIVSRPQGMLPHHFVTHMLRSKVADMGLSLVQRAHMESNITRLVDDMGACENIFATPIPVGYAKQTTYFLFLWLFFLPWALQGPLGLGVVFGQQLLSFFLLGIEDIGIQIEQPFDMLPLKKICFKISNEAKTVRANFDALEDAAAVSRKQGSLATVRRHG